MVAIQNAKRCSQFQRSGLIFLRSPNRVFGLPISSDAYRVRKRDRTKFRTRRFPVVVFAPPRPRSPSLSFRSGAWQAQTRQRRLRIGNLGQCYIRSGSQYLLHFQQRNLAKVNSRTLSMSSQWKAQLKFHVSAGHRAYQLGTYDFLLRLVTETLHLNFVNDGVLLRTHDAENAGHSCGF